MVVDCRIVAAPPYSTACSRAQSMVTVTIDVDICVHTSADEESTYNHRAFHPLRSASLGSPEPESTTNEATNEKEALDLSQARRS